MPGGADVTVPLPVTETDSVRRVGATFVNVACTVSSFPMLNEHEPEPEQAPLHPLKEKPLSGVAVSATDVPLVKLAEQVPGQEMPAGVDVTVPLPVTETDSVRCGAATLVNVACTVSSLPIVNAHEPEPVQAPPHPVKEKPLSAVAASWSAVPTANAAEHVPGQAIAAGVDVTRPEPETFTESVARSGGGMSANVAFTVTSALATKSQLPDPVQGPDHREKRAPASGAASR
jgi:hypothetical protein